MTMVRQQRPISPDHEDIKTISVAIISLTYIIDDIIKRNPPYRCRKARLSCFLCDFPPSWWVNFDSQFDDVNTPYGSGGHAHNTKRLVYQLNTLLHQQQGTGGSFYWRPKFHHGWRPIDIPHSQILYIMPKLGKRHQPTRYFRWLWEFVCSTKLHFYVSLRESFVRLRPRKGSLW